MTAPSRRRLSIAAALLAAATMLVASPSVAGAEPGDSSTGVDSEGGTPLLRDVLQSTAKGYLEAKTALTSSQKRQLKLTLEVQQAQDRLKELDPQIGELAAEAYRAGRLSTMTTILNTTTRDSFVQRVVALNEMSVLNNQTLHEINEALTESTRAKTALEAEIAEEQKQLQVMDKQKKEAEKALALVGGKATGGFVSATSPVAKAAPRAADGSFPAQSCNQNDPTTSGCITARTLHSLNQARNNGFNRFVACFRTGGPFEHPKGRACDYSPQENGFGADATGAAKTYGNNLAAFFVRNADRLGLLYVIWYRQIWFPATGWRSYSEANGDPSSDHTNHVHVSVL